MPTKKVVLMSAPELVNHRNPAVPSSPLIVEIKATKEISCRVISAIVTDENGHYRVNTAVCYGDGGEWFKKDSRLAFGLRDAVEVVYHEARLHYGKVASRALAGLLHDSVVPATEDIDF